MTYNPSNNCTRNFCNRTILVHVTVENVVVFYSDRPHGLNIVSARHQAIRRWWKAIAVSAITAAARTSYSRTSWQWWETLMWHWFLCGLWIWRHYIIIYSDTLFTR